MEETVPDPNGPRYWTPESCMERFPSYTASQRGSITTSQLPHSRREKYISTAISLDGKLVAAATTDKVRIYCFRSMIPNPIEEWKLRETLNISLSKGEHFRALALSNDLLAVVTHKRLIVYQEVRAIGDMKPELVVDENIDERGVWAPLSVSISQKSQQPIGAPFHMWAWIAVGSAGVTELKLFKLLKHRRWDLQNNRSILKCSQEIGSLNIVGFSPPCFNSPNASIVIGVTASDDIYCWDLGVTMSHRPMKPTWHIPPRSGQNGDPSRSSIKSATVFFSQAGRPYIFCTIARRPGTLALGSFIAPIRSFPLGHKYKDTPLHQIEDLITSRNVLMGTMSPNGLFGVAVENDRMRLITLKGVARGLACLDHSFSWPSRLEETRTKVSAISISIVETYGSLKILAVDGRSNMIQRVIHVPDMPATLEPPPRLPSFSTMAELPAFERFELDADAERASGSVSTAN